MSNARDGFFENIRNFFAGIQIFAPEPVRPKITSNEIKRLMECLQFYKAVGSYRHDYVLIAFHKKDRASIEALRDEGHHLNGGSRKTFFQVPYKDSYGIKHGLKGLYCKKVPIRTYQKIRTHLSEQYQIDLKEYDDLLSTPKIREQLKQKKGLIELVEMNSTKQVSTELAAKREHAKRNRKVMSNEPETQPLGAEEDAKNKWKEKEEPQKPVFSGKFLSINTSEKQDTASPSGNTASINFDPRLN